MKAHMNRRRFLGTAAGAATLAWAPWGMAQTTPARTERLRIGVIGVAGRGVPNIDGVAHENIIALCDVDTDRAAPLRKRFPDAQFYTDYRRLLDNRAIEAVVIATPDHHHAFAALPALQSGKHVYCEKPLAHSVYEVRRMMEAAGRAKVVTQMGTQIHAGENYRRVVEIVQAGLIGPVRRVHVWCERKADPGQRAQGNPMPPANLDYDLWLGPAPARPYHASHLHFNWRWWWDFGGGVLADMACHFMDLPHWALNLRQPRTIAAQGRVTYKGDNEMPDVMQVEYEHPARGQQPPVHLTWYHGVRGPDLEGKRTFQGFPSGVLFEGDKGQLVANYSNYRLLPEDQYRDVQLPRPTLARSIGHHREWLAAIRGEGQTTCDFQYSGALTETVLLGNVAYRSGAKLEYDAAAGRVTNHREAERFMRRDYRRGWTL